MSRSLIPAALLFLPLAALSAAPKQGPPLSLSVETPKQPLKAGQRLILKVNVTNTSDNSLTVPASEGVFAMGAIYQIHVRAAFRATP